MALTFAKLKKGVVVIQRYFITSKLINNGVYETESLGHSEVTPAAESDQERPCVLQGGISDAKASL